MKRDGVPDGSFVFVSATGLLATWWAYKRQMIQFRDVRVWLASHELLAQRWFLEKGHAPRYRVEELGPLVGGVGGEHFRASLRRLEAIGLLRWSESRIEPTKSLTTVREGDADDLQAFVECVKNNRRKVPVPRRLLKLLASETRPVFVATALGHLLRCMYYRKGRCSPSGLCKASWIANVFKVDERNVKAARRDLVASRGGKPGVLIRGVAKQGILKRHGVPMRFNLEWETPSEHCQTPPLQPLSTTETPPLRETGNSSFGRSGNQKPRGPGVRKRTSGAPSLRHVTELDLVDPRRTLDLHRQAAALAGLVGSSEAERLKVLALAAHARAHAKRNAPGLFVTVLREQRWHYLTLPDEDCARRHLHALRHSDTPTRITRLRDDPGEDASAVRSLIARSLASVDGNKRIAR